ncbi:NAD(P)/FAD-dependent oxidoreductase [Actinophytocola oryzae]|uniref:Thioredoxin reductase n=1 Tax=Actinophytocola oryzae TaxID=502181 RepID=A0A4R7W4Q8_9PSEU|nr:NAD(P)/FAD-dependent oxidoreductase [Actinophytocola oryzae]TDV57195.1 thioredoxin reductase [Actinophytocola oryzae]
MVADIAVLGAGPAGLAAAVAAHRAGARVTLVDSASRVGGQYWRHRDGAEPAGLRPFTDVPLDFRAGHAIWHVERTDDGFTTHTSAGEVLSRKVIVATGAYDRQVPFPGWTLPGVFTAGGAQALLKGHGVVAGDRVVVAGTGPFLLPVAAGLARAGARVLGVFEAGSPLGFTRRPAAVLRNPGKLAEGAGYLRVLRKRRIPFHTRQTVVAAHGDDQVRAVTVATLDRDWHVVSHRELECDTVAVGYGFTPQLEIPLQLGCATHLDLDGSLVATADDRQRASVPDVFLAGEVCGIGGVQLSLVEGELAGRHAAGAEPDARVLRRRAALRAFAAAMHRTYPVPPGWQTWLADDTLVCRCEEVSAATIRRSIVDLGATDPRAVKLVARPGMGLCQGRVCGYATACLVSRPVTADGLRGMATRPIAQPVTLGELARQHVEER